VFNQLRIGVFKFYIEAGPTGLELPAYWGSTFRGAFGSAFKKIACVDRNQKSCHDCQMEANCSYAYVFETTPPEGSKLMGNFDDIPRPFMFVPKLRGKTSFQPKEELEIELRLFGRGHDFFPYFVLAFNQMGETGLGAKRKPFRLKRVVSINPLQRSQQTVYEGAENKIYAVKNSVTGEQNVLLAFSKKEASNNIHSTHNTQTHNNRESYQNTGIQNVRITYLTPLRIKENGKLVSKIEFHHLVRSLLRRATAIMAFHHGVKLELDFAGISERSRLVRCIEDHTQWYEFERYSGRQREKMILGGVIGEATYQGDLTEFLPFLEFGRWVGAGKNNVFGLGQMDVVVCVS